MDTRRSVINRRQISSSRDSGIKLSYLEVCEEGEVHDRLLYLPLVSFEGYRGEHFRWEGYWKDAKISATYDRKAGTARFSTEFPNTHITAAQQEIDRVMRRFQ